MTTFQHIYNLANEIAESQLDYVLDPAKFKLAAIPVLKKIGIFAADIVEDEEVKTTAAAKYNYAELPQNLETIVSVKSGETNLFQRDSIADFINPLSYVKAGRLLYVPTLHTDLRIKYTSNIKDTAKLTFPDNDILQLALVYGILYHYAYSQKIFNNKGTQVRLDMLRQTYQSNLALYEADINNLQLKSIYDKNVK